MANRRLVLAFSLLLVALLAATQTSAFKVSGIRNTSSLTVSQSDVAGLAVAKSTGNSLNQVTYAGGQVQVHFGKGASGGIFALQTNRTQSTRAVAGDNLKMLSVLNVTNNSTYCQDVTVQVSSGTAVNLTNIYGRPPGGAQPGTLLFTPPSTTNIFKLQPAGQMVVDFWWNATSAASPAGNFTLTVKGTQSASCP